MENVTIKTFELLAKVRENRDKHEKEYHEACVEYKVAAINIAEKALRDFNEKTFTQLLAKDAYEPVELDPIYFNIDVPVSHLKEYDELITMLVMCANSTVTLSKRDFIKYAMDEWEWKESELHKRLFYASNSVSGR
jgi:hypothetical protein